MKRNVFIYGFGSADCHDNNRNMCFLGDFEDTVMKRQKLQILAPCSFRIDGNGTFIRLDQMRGILNGCKCLFGILTVNCHETTFPDQASPDRNFKIIGLGYKGEIACTQDMPSDNRIIIGTMVADQKKTAGFRQVLHAAAMRADTDQF